MKVLHFLNTNSFSGAENVACQIIQMMRPEDDCQMVYCSLDGPVRTALGDRAIAFEPLEAMTVGEVRRVIRKLKPDVVHAHDMRASLICALACGRVPLVCHIHNNAFDARKISVRSVAFLVAAVKAKCIFWVAESALQDFRFRSLVTKKSQVLQNILDADVLRNRMNEDAARYPYDVVYVGRLTDVKNPLRLIRVAGKVISACPDARFAVVGKGELEEPAKELAKELRIDRQIDFLGFKSNPLKVMHDSKVMLMTSRREGLPMCALEAMALGVPIVGTPVDGLLSVIQEGKNGYLSEDDDVLASRIAEIIRDERLCGVLSQGALETSGMLNNVAVYRARLKDTYASALK